MNRWMLCAGIALALATGVPASAQGFDPESGDTGDGWAPPPDNPPDNNQNQNNGQQNNGQNNGWNQGNQNQGNQNQGNQNQGNQNQGWNQQPNNQGNGQQQQGNGQQGWFNNNGQDQERPPGMGGDQNGGGNQDQTPAGETDHDQVGFGISFFGINELAIAPSGIGDSLNLRLATVGIRYWLGTVGIDVGIGLGTTTRKDFNTCQADPGGPIDCGAGSHRDGGIDGAFGFGLHLGLPIAIKSSRHATLLFIPELGFAYGSATVFVSATDPAFDLDLTGLQIDAGLRVGGEVQFGAIGLPNLGLQLSIGIGIRWNKTTAENGTPAMDPAAVGRETTNVSLRTVANDLLNGLVRLNYYF